MLETPQALASGERAGDTFKGRSSAEWVEALKYPDTKGEAEAALSNVTVEEADILIPPLCGLIQTEDWVTRYYALQAISLMGPRAIKAVSCVTRALQDGTAEVRRTACLALGKIGSATEPTVLGIAGRLGDLDQTVRIQAAVTLKELGPGSAPALPALLRALNRRENLTTKYVITAIGAIGPPAESAMPILQGFEADPDIHVREAAKSAIQRIQKADPQ
jgi:HEAT repeat protein